MDFWARLWTDRVSRVMLWLMAQPDKSWQQRVDDKQIRSTFLGRLLILKRMTSVNPICILGCSLSNKQSWKEKPSLMLIRGSHVEVPSRNSSLFCRNFLHSIRETCEGCVLNPCVSSYRSINFSLEMDLEMTTIYLPQIPHFIATEAVIQAAGHQHRTFKS